MSKIVERCKQDTQLNIAQKGLSQELTICLLTIILIVLPQVPCSKIRIKISDVYLILVSPVNISLDLLYFFWLELMHRLAQSINQ